MTDKSAEQSLQQILAEMKKQTAILQQLAVVVSAIWNQIDDTPVGFKINETKL